MAWYHGPYKCPYPSPDNVKAFPVTPVVIARCGEVVMRHFSFLKNFYGHGRYLLIMYRNTLAQTKSIRSYP